MQGFHRALGAMLWYSKACLRVRKHGARALRAGGWTAAVLALAALGCAKKPVPVDVTGKVEFAVPKPKAPLLILLSPQDDANKMTAPSSPIDDKDGSFKFEKCLPGRYKATIAVIPALINGGVTGAPGGGLPALGGPGAADLPKKYQNIQLTPWEVTVPEGGKDGLVLTLAP